MRSQTDHPQQPRSQDSLTTYPEAGSFVGYLISTYGMAKFKQAYVAGETPHRCPPCRGLRKVPRTARDRLARNHPIVPRGWQVVALVAGSLPNCTSSNMR